MRLAPTRLVPFSYFCTCWNVRPSASPSFSWLMPSMMRRMRTRLPTYLSTGLGALVDIANAPRDNGARYGKNEWGSLEFRLTNLRYERADFGIRYAEQDYA